MNKRYQVFVSSTYADLQEERREVMQALLELDCIPAGMELFPAADESQWSLIRRIIDDCDYYIVIVGGRYGSTDSDGISYTEMEYRHALKLGKPIVAFLHRDPSSIPANRTETSDKRRAKLDEFRNLCQQKMVKYWTSAAELGSVVSRSLVRLTRDRPGVGWVRADAVPNHDVLQQLVEKNERIEALQRLTASAQHVGLVATYDCTGNYGNKSQWLEFLNETRESMDLMGRTLYEWIRAPEFEESLITKIERDGVTFRWLMMSKSNRHLEELEEDGEGIGEVIAKKIDPVCRRLAAIRARLPPDKRGLLQIRQFERVPLYCSILRADDTYLITPYLQSAASRNSPLLALRGNSSAWVAAYSREFEMVWAAASVPDGFEDI